MAWLDRHGRVAATTAAALLALSMGASLGHGSVIPAWAHTESAQQTAGQDAQQRAQEDQATAEAAQQAVSNELQQTENLEFQTINEERPPSFQQIEP